MTQFQRGILVDYEGHFIAAIQWESDGLPPNFNMPRRGSQTGRTRPVSAEERKTIVTDQVAIDTVDPRGRWDGSQWVLPTVRRWIVTRRRDRAERAFLVGSRLVWPNRLPRLPQGQEWVDVPPPSDIGAAKALFDTENRVWIAPRKRVVCDGDGVIVNRIVTYGDEDDEVQAVPSGGFVIDDDPSVLVGEDEAEQTVIADVGDAVSRGSDGVVRGAVINRRPGYQHFPVRMLWVALDRANIEDEFRAFLAAEEITEEQLSSLESISLNSRVLRQFIRSQGMTFQQARNRIERIALVALDQERAFKEQNE